METEPTAPPDLRKLLAADPQARMLWGSLTPIARRDFISWIDSAKQPQTREGRVARVPDMLASGKRRPCCYAVVPLKLYKALESNPKAKTQWRGLTSAERRDLIGWIDAAKDRETNHLRIEKSCALLAAGKRRPVQAAR